MNIKSGVYREVPPHVERELFTSHWQQLRWQIKNIKLQH